MTYVIAGELSAVLSGVTRESGKVAQNVRRCFSNSFLDIRISFIELPATDL